jgi:RND family efflux transporter MFP subunit
MNKSVKLNLALLLLVVAGCKSSTEDVSSESRELKEETIKVQVQTVKPSSVSYSYSYSGLVTPSQSAGLSFPIPGTMQTLLVDEGDVVKKGQLIGSIANANYNSQFQQASAVKDQATDAYNRLKEVHDKGSLPEIQWQEAISKKKQAEAAFQISQKLLSDCQMKAPADGVIGSIYFEPGTNVMPMQPVVDLVQMDQIHVKVSVPEKEINKIKKGDTAMVTIGALDYNTYQGIVTTLGAVANPVARTYTVKIELDNPTGSIKPGMITDVVINTNMEASPIMVPSIAIVHQINDEYLYVVDSKSKVARLQKVELGNYLDNKVIVKNGIRNGDLIVVKGQHKLKDQTTVTF